MFSLLFFFYFYFTPLFLNKTTGSKSKTCLAGEIHLCAEAPTSHDINCQISFWKDLGWSHTSPSSDEQSSAVEVPILLQSTEMTQGHTVPFFKDLQANKARNSFFVVLFGDFSHPKFLSQTKISGLVSFGFSYPSSAAFSLLNTRYQVLMIFHWFCLRKMSLKVTCMYSSIHDTEISYYVYKLHMDSSNNKQALCYTLHRYTF